MGEWGKLCSTKRNLHHGLMRLGNASAGLACGWVDLPYHAKWRITLQVQGTLPHDRPNSSTSRNSPDETVRVRLSSGQSQAAGLAKKRMNRALQQARMAVKGTTVFGMMKLVDKNVQQGQKDAAAAWRKSREGGGGVTVQTREEVDKEAQPEVVKKKKPPPSQAPPPPDGHGKQVSITNADCASTVPSDPQNVGMNSNLAITHQSGIIPVQAEVTGSRLYFRFAFHSPVSHAAEHMRVLSGVAQVVVPPTNHAAIAKAAAANKQRHLQNKQKQMQMQRRANKEAVMAWDEGGSDVIDYSQTWTGQQQQQNQWMMKKIADRQDKSKCNSMKHIIKTRSESAAAKRERQEIKAAMDDLSRFKAFEARRVYD